MGEENLKSIKENKEDSKLLRDKEQKLLKWQEKLASAKQEINTSKFDIREKLYAGDHAIYNETSKNGKKEVRNVVNVVYDLLESEVDNSIPQCSISSKRPTYVRQASIAEDAIKNDITELGIDRLNDKAERTTYIHGYSVYALSWDNSKGNHLQSGEIEINEIHPKAFVPQPNIFEIQKMDYCFILNSVSISYIKGRYGIKLENPYEEYPDINSVDGEQNNSNDMVTECICWYKDEDGDIGRFVWVNDTILEDLPKYYYRRDEEGNVLEYEELDSEIVTNRMEEVQAPDGSIVEQPIVIPAREIEVDENGNPVIDEFNKPKTVKTKIPYYVPKLFPIVVRINVPKAFSFGGMSDVDIIKDQQEAIKKVISTVEEKILRGAAIITALEDHGFSLTNELYQVVRGNMQQLSALKSLNLNADIDKELQFAQYMYQSAQSTLGITDSYQGKKDPTATSGKAKEALIQQAASRLQSKILNKFAAYTELYRLMFMFKLSFYDETRHYIKKGSTGEDEFFEFSKYDYLMQDSAGCWFYNDDFMFSVDGGGLSKDKNWLLEKAEINFRLGTINKTQYWALLETLKFPLASENKKIAQQELGMEAQLQAMQEENQRLLKLLNETEHDNNAAMKQRSNEVKMRQLDMKEKEMDRQEGEEVNENILQNKEMLAQILSQLSPEQQKAFFDMDEREQLEMLQEILQK